MQIFQALNCHFFKPNLFSRISSKKHCRTIQVQLYYNFFALFGRFSTVSGESSPTSSLVVMVRFQSYTRPICFSFMFPLLQLGLEQFSPFSGSHPARQGRDSAHRWENEAGRDRVPPPMSMNFAQLLFAWTAERGGGTTPGTVECGPTGAETFIMYLIHFTC